jgi:hypothetical protein
MKPRKPFLLRMSPDLYAALESWAQQEMRSVNGQIEYILKEAVGKHNRSSIDWPDDRQRQNESTPSLDTPRHMGDTFDH